MPELETLTASGLQSAIASGTDTAIVPFGSIEHHGGHLPMGADALLCDFVGSEVARRLDALQVPTFRVGYDLHQRRLVGTLALRSGTLTRLACEIAESLARDRMRVVALVSTHGGNADPLRAAVAHLRSTLPDCIVCAPWGNLGPEAGTRSGEWLTSVMLALRPDLVHLEAAPGELAGELTGASAARGAEHLERFVASVVAQVRDATRWR